MSAIATTDSLFFHRADAQLDQETAARITAEALRGADDGELFLEYRESESISMEDGRIRAANYDSASGFGLRAVLGEETGYAHAGELSEAALKRAAATVSAVRGGRTGTASVGPRSTNSRLYSDASPLATGEFGTRAATLGEMLDWAQQRRLDRLAPTHLIVPSGSRIAIDYNSGDQPVLAVKLQELFGLTEHPTIAEGRIRLVLHLLSPAQRPIQVTSDLAGFWTGSYKAVRADLRGRYPKHPWPEDPLTAPPTARAKPRGQ